MVDMNNLQTGIDTLKSEILDEILDHLANTGESNTLILTPMWVTDSRTYSRGVRRAAS